MTYPLQRHRALPVAVVGMWTLASVAVWLLIRSGDWSILTSDDPVLTMAQIGGFYVAWTGVQIPAVVLVAFVISYSTFHHRMSVAAVITVVCGLLSGGSRAVRGPWSGVAGVAGWMPVAFELLGVLLLALLAVLFTWMIGKAGRTVEATADPPGS